MTAPRDPVEDWLGADVELMPPRPGSFERVHGAARRRKATRAAGAIAGAAFVVAAAVIAPRLAGTLLPHGQPAKYTSSSAHPSPGHPSRHHKQTRQALPGPSLTDTTAGPPGANFWPTSVTFVGTRVGAVIGRARSCGASICTAIAGTENYGRTWHRVGAPPAGASQIRFLDKTNGWAFGPALYATHNGGATWRAVSLPGRVIDLSAVGNRAFAVVASGSGAFALYSARATTADNWQIVAGAASSAPELPGGLQLTGTYGYLLASGKLFAGPVTGAAWQQVPVSAGTPACLRRAAARGTALLAPAPNGTVFLACGARPSAIAVYTSADRGRTWQRLGPVTVSGTPLSLAVAPGSDALVLATSRTLGYSAGGRTWRSVTVLSGGFSFVGMTTQFLGVAVPANPGMHEIFTTTDGGLAWQPRLIQG